jgi:2-iminobutanoate/2-iminopropanoate deaminase
MKKIAISTDRAPAAVGPYSQAVRAGGLIFVSGQIGISPETGALVAGRVAEQTRQALTNLKAILAQAQVGLDEVVKTTVLLTDMADYKAVNEIYAEYFGDVPPARAAFAVAALPLGALVEIEAVAVEAG